MVGIMYPPLVRIGLTYLPKTGGDKTPSPLLAANPTSLSTVSKHFARSRDSHTHGTPSLLLLSFSAYLGACHTGIHNPQEDRRHRQVCAPGPGASSTHILLSTLVTTCSSVHSYRRQEAALRASASGRPLPSPLGPPRSRLQPRALRASPRCPAPRACPPAARAPRPRRAPTPEGTCNPHMHAPHARPAPWEAPW